MIIRIKQANIDLMLWKWSADDFKVPLLIPLKDCNAEITLDPSHMGATQKDRQWLMYADILLTFTAPDEKFENGIRHQQSKDAAYSANKIYETYRECLEILAIYIRKVLPFHGLLNFHSHFSDMFQGWFSTTKVAWSSDGTSFHPFSYAQPRSRKINPVFKSRFLIKPKDWTKLQKVVSSQPLPSKEIQELLRLRTRTKWNEKRVTIIEAMAITELVLKTRTKALLFAKGVKRDVLDKLDDRLEFAVLLNHMLPLSLSGGKYKRIKPVLGKVDKARKIRNKIMHENLSEDKISQEEAYKGVDAALRLVEFLQKS